MKPETNASEYAPLAKLPKLKTFDIFGYPEEGSLRALFRSMVVNRSNDSLALRIQEAKLGSEEIEELSKVCSIDRISCELKPTRSSASLSPIDLPNILPLSLGMEPKGDSILHFYSFDILNSMGNIGLFIKKEMDKNIIIKLNEWHSCFKNGLSPILLEKEKLKQSLSRITNINSPERIAKIAAISLLGSLLSQIPSIVHNIQLLTKIRELRELEVKVELNIEDDLWQVMDPNESVTPKDLESNIVIDSDTQIIIVLVQLAYLKDILKNSKFANIKNNIAINKYKFELCFDIRFRECSVAS
nr:uncharacterized protein LOC108057330 isoform X1 [Drosophila takahashii]XP_016997030.2 uncharacterized protein LOC108057330 isoform X1 [Drosophila takahashii]